MEDVVAGSIVGAAAQAVIDKLFSLFSLKFDQVEEFKGDMEKLKCNFEWIQATLDDAGMQHITSRVVKLWLRKLDDISDEAFHALDEFHYHLLRQMRNNMEMEAQTSLMRKAKSIFSGSSSKDPRQILGGKVKDINERLDSLLNQEANYLGIHQMILGSATNTPAVAFASPETDSFNVDPVFIEREKDVSAIVETLANIPTESVLSVLPIVGMGGLGKTTLAREVYHHARVSARFPTRIWVHVSPSFDHITLFKKILTTLTSKKVEVENREVVLGKLQIALAGKTFLLVLDDVWNQDPRMWEDFINPLSRICSSKGNGIVVTTRNSEVGSIVGTLPIYELQGLSREGCWSIIKAKSFGERETPLEFQIIGENIAKRCQGLPLAANVIGGLLCRKSMDDWVSIEQNWLSDFDGDDNISKILKLSFHYLPSLSLKKCFVYCSFSSKGVWIRRKELIELWMAEGFLQSSDMEKVGNKYFNLLLQNSLLQNSLRRVFNRDEHDNVELCSMHDLVHDLADSISNDTYNARYIRWQCSGDASSRIPKEKAKRCHALWYAGPISDITFSDFKSLHSLTLISYDDVKELPDSIRDLIHLRYLNITHTRIKHLPESIGELYHLQTLRTFDSPFEFSSPLEKVPSTLKYLYNLRHLHLSKYTKLLPHIGTLTSLRTLQYFEVLDEDGHRIVELERLKNLQGELEIRSLEKVQGVEESEKANLIQKSGIISLVLSWNTIWRKSIESKINDEEVLKGLQPHPNLKKLKIKGFKGTSFPPWTLRMAVCLQRNWIGLNNLMEIRLHDCEECEEIPTLGHLPCLKSLDLDHLRNVKSIGPSFYGIDRCSSNTGISNETIIVFSALESLTLKNMTNLRDWAEVEIPSAGETHEARDIKVFPRLTDLVIEECKQLVNICGIKSTSPTILEMLVVEDMPNLREWAEVEIPSAGETHEARDINVFPRLENLKIRKCKQMANICGIKSTYLTNLQIDGLDELVYLPDCIFLNKQNLRNLEISWCPKLRELPDGLQTLTSLRNLEISYCDNLKPMPYFRVDFPCEVGLRNLQKLDISDSDCESLPDELQHLSALEKLSLKDLEIEELPEWIGNLSSLQLLHLWNCKQLRSLPSVEAMHSLTTLKRLEIIDCPLLKERCKSDDDDSEWPKISHIPDISIDHRRIQGRSDFFARMDWELVISTNTQSQELQAVEESTVLGSNATSHQLREKATDVLE